MNRDTVLPDILTVKELADYLHCHSSTIYRMLKRHEIPAFRVGSDWRFSRRSIDDWIESKEAGESRPLDTRLDARQT